MNISKNHPRFWSLAIRETLAGALDEGIMVPQGLIAHGRGEAFDYMIGEKTLKPATRATSAAAALLLTASHPVVSVNGNTVALVGKDIVKLASRVHAPLEVNLFHRTTTRERRIARYLKRLGAKEILGIGKAASKVTIGVSSARKRIDPRGIATADAILIPLEDGDRAEALQRAGKKIVAIDLNPISRTSRVASISIVDNIIRAVPALIKDVGRMKSMPRSRLLSIVRNFDNDRNLSESIDEMVRYLKGWTRE